MRHVPISRVIVPALTDQQLADFMVIDVSLVPRLTPARRKAYEALADAERRIKLWQDGKADKPTDILIDGDR